MNDIIPWEEWVARVKPLYYKGKRGRPPKGIEKMLRMPLTRDNYSLTARSGCLQLYGRNGLSSRYSQSLIAQRLTEFSGVVQTGVSFEPFSFKQMAGLILYYDYDNYLYLHLTHDEEMGLVLSLLVAENKQYRYPIGFIPITCQQQIHLRIQLYQGVANCSYRMDEELAFHDIGAPTDVSFLSDEACQEGWFTGQWSVSAVRI